MEATKDPTFFKLVILDGKVYMEKYNRACQTRDMFTIWGILYLSFSHNYILKIIHLFLFFTCVDPVFSCAFPLDGVTRFFYLFSEELIFRKKLGVTTYFYFIFEGKNKIRKKNPKCNSWRKKTSL